MQYPLFVPLIFLFLFSCAQHNKLIEKHKTALEYNQVKDDFEKDFKVSPTSKNYLLNNEEVARTAFILNRQDLTKTSFVKVINFYNALDEKAIINAKGVASNLVASTVGSDNARTYVGADFERSLSYFYNAINYLKFGKLSNAMVEIRAANNSQKYAIAKREKQIYNAESQQYNLSPELNQAINSSNNILQSTKKRFLNPYIYYLSGNIRELNGDFNGALVDYKLALEIYPDNPYLIADALRLSEIKDRSYYQRLKSEHNIKYTNATDYKKSNTVVVIYEQGFIPIQSAIQGKIFLINGIYTISLPAYNQPQNPKNTVKVDLMNHTNIVASAKADEIVNIYYLAKNNLAENYSTIIARQIARLGTKTVVQTVAKQNDMPILRIVGGVSSLLERADTRSFSTLPSYVLVAKINTKQDFNEVKLNINGRIVTFKDIQKGNNTITFLYVIDLGFSVYTSVVYQANK